MEIRRSVLIRSQRCKNLGKKIEKINNQTYAHNCSTISTCVLYVKHYNEQSHLTNCSEQCSYLRTEAERMNWQVNCKLSFVACYSTACHFTNLQEEMINKLVSITTQYNYNAYEIKFINNINRTIPAVFCFKNNTPQK